MDASSRFSEIARLPDEEIDLAEAALAIAADEYPELDVASELARLDDHARRARPGIDASSGDRGKISALAHYLFSEIGFRGDVEDYENPRNSYLNDVLDRKLGIPITLSVLMIEVGRRCGVELSGVAFPGHFLVRSTGDPALIVDPFDAGRFVGRKECEEILRRQTAGRVRFDPALLAAAGRRKILVRMLNNLRASYGKRRDTRRLIQVLGALMALEPDEGTALRDRGILLIERGSDAAGIEDLERFLLEHPSGEGNESARASLDRARGRLYPVN